MIFDLRSTNSISARNVVLHRPGVTHLLRHRPFSPRQRRSMTVAGSSPHEKFPPPRRRALWEAPAKHLNHEIHESHESITEGIQGVRPPSDEELKSWDSLLKRMQPWRKRSYTNTVGVSFVRDLYGIPPFLLRVRRVLRARLRRVGDRRSRLNSCSSAWLG
jgi:hypothetical protein